MQYNSMFAATRTAKKRLEQSMYQDQPTRKPRIPNYCTGQHNLSHGFHRQSLLQQPQYLASREEEPCRASNHLKGNYSTVISFFLQKFGSTVISSSSIMILECRNIATIIFAVNPTLNNCFSQSFRHNLPIINLQTMFIPIQIISTLTYKSQQYSQFRSLAKLSLKQEI